MLIAVVLLLALLVAAAGAAGLALAGLAHAGGPSAEDDHTTVQQAAVAIVLMTGGLAYTVSQIARGVRWAWMAVVAFVALQGVGFLIQALRLANTAGVEATLYAVAVVLEVVAVMLLVRRDVRAWVKAVSAATPASPEAARIPD